MGSDYTAQYTNLDSLGLHHLEWAGGSPAVVYLPGFIASAYGALHLGAALAPERRVLALDLRGRGGSDKPASDYGFETHVKDLRAWLAAQGLERIVLAGHSFGASLALLFTARYPAMVERVILYDGGLPPSEAAFQLFLAYHSNLKYSYASLEAYLAPYRAMVTLQPWTDEAEALIRANVLEEADGSVTRVVPPHVVEAELAALDFKRWEELAAIYRGLACPVLLIRAGLGSFGADDQHIRAEGLASLKSLISDLSVYDMPQAGHTGVLTVLDAGRDAAIREFVLSDK